MLVRKTRRLPIPGEVLVKEGEEVDFKAIIARTKLAGEPEIVKVAILLGVEPEDIPRYMMKKEGDKVKEGEVIAHYRAFFGLIKRSVTSPADGTVESISDITGQVVIRRPPVPLEVDAYIPGKVIEVLPNEGAVIETNAAFIQGIFGVGGETHGKIRMAVDSPEEELTPDHISDRDKGAILIGGSLVTLDALRRGVEVGVSCIVAGGIRHNDLTEFMGEEIGVAITGHEEVGLTLIVTEGFGKLRMSRRAFNLFEGFEGYTAAANGATQIRAGVMRPEVIIPHGELYEERGGDELAAGMVPGTPVRIIRAPYFGAIGRVRSLPIDLEQVETESYVRVLEVELEDGRVVTVPRANVEIIEE
jgi:hypothetical protein